MRRYGKSLVKDTREMRERRTEFLAVSRGNCTLKIAEITGFSAGWSEVEKSAELASGIARLQESGQPFLGFHSTKPQPG